MNDEPEVRAEAQLIKRETGKSHTWSIWEARRRLSLPPLDDGPSYKRFRASISVKRSPHLAFLVSQFEDALLAPALRYRRGYVVERPVTEFAFQPRSDSRVWLIGRSDGSMEGWIEDGHGAALSLSARDRSWIEAWFIAMIEELGADDIFGHLLGDADGMLAHFEHNTAAVCDLTTCSRHVVDDPEYYQVAAEAWIGMRESPSEPEGYDIHHHQDHVTRITQYQWRTTDEAERFGPCMLSRPKGHPGGADGLRVVAHGGENVDLNQEWFSRAAAHQLIFSVPEEDVPDPVQTFIHEDYAVQQDGLGSVRAVVFREMLHALAGLPPVSATVVPQIEDFTWEPSPTTKQARGFSAGEQPVDGFLVAIPIPTLPTSNLTPKVLRFAPDIQLRVLPTWPVEATSLGLFVESVYITGRPSARLASGKLQMLGASPAKTGLSRRQAEHLRAWLREAHAALIGLSMQRQVMRGRVVGAFQRPQELSAPGGGEVNVDDLDRVITVDIPLGRLRELPDSPADNALSYDPALEAYLGGIMPLSIAEALPGGEKRHLGTFMITGPEAATIQWLGDEPEEGLSEAEADARQRAAIQVVMARACATEAEGVLLSAVMGLAPDL